MKTLAYRDIEVDWDFMACGETVRGLESCTKTSQENSRALHGEHLFVDGQKMSKSKGNIYYPESLIKKGYNREHMRFFLIYGHYRRKLDFSLEKMQKTGKKLDRLRNMVAELQKTESTLSNDPAQKIVEEIVAAFEKHMNNDLDVKAAFDDVFAAVSKLNTLREKARLPRQDARNAITNLRKIDRVLEIIF